MKNWICVFALLLSACASSPFSGPNPFEHTELLLEAEETIGGGDQCFGDSAETSRAHQGHCDVSESGEDGYDRLGPRRKRGGDRSIPKDRKMESAGFYQIPAGQLGNSGRDLESRTGAFGGDQQGTQTIIQDAI